jgi:hypothetical protein
LGATVVYIPRLTMLENLTCENFENLLNHVFRLNYGAGTIDLRLAQCERLSSGGGIGGRRKPFSLIFLGPQHPVLPQQIYQFERAQRLIFIAR